MRFIRIIIALALGCNAAWNAYVISTGGASRDIMNIASVVVPAAITLLLFIPEILQALVGSGIKLPQLNKGIDTNQLSKIIDEYKKGSEPVAPTPTPTPAPEQPKEDNPRDLQNQQEILSAINVLYAHFEGDTTALALVANVAKAFAAKCYPVEQKK